jgi:hypothetical protein
MPVDDRFIVRGFRDGDETAILDLFARSFPHAPRALEHFEWKYRRNPAGNERISLAFEPNGELAGHYAGYPVVFRRNGADVLTHHIGDTMTAPAVRHVGRGPTSVLGRVASHFFTSFCEGNVAFNYGFNVSNIQRFSTRFLRSFVVEPVTYRVLDLTAHPLRPVSWLDRIFHRYEIEQVTRTTPEWDELFARVENDYRFLVKRDARYVQWRYLDAPDTSYTVLAVRRKKVLAGWGVFRRDNARLIWGDALFDPAAVDGIGPLLHHAVTQSSAVLVDGWFPRKPVWLDAALNRLHFEVRPEPQNLSVMATPFEWADAVDRMRAELYYTWGDSDLF